MRKRRYSREVFLGRVREVLRQMDSTHEVDSMDTVEVMYRLCQHDQLGTVGSPSTGFAYVCPVTQKLQVVARSSEHVSLSLDVADTLRAACLAVCERGARFVSAGDSVICSVNGVRAWGASEGEAALRAFAKLQLTEKNSH